MEGSSRKKRKLNNSGLTLVELIVTFMLLGIFMVAASMMISSIMNVYYEAKGTSYGLQVTKLLNDKIAEKLEGALVESINSVSAGDADATDSSNKVAMSISGDGEKIEFIDKTGSHVYLGLWSDEDEASGDKYLTVHYYEVASSNPDADNIYDAVDWRFDSAAYMGYSIKELKFSKPAGAYGGNIIKVELTITSSKYGDFSSTQFVECYNFDDGTNIIDNSTEEVTQ
jgi:hypothetical protein